MVFKLCSSDFAGCLQNAIWINSNLVSIPLSMIDARNVRFDGCPDVTSSMQQCLDTSSQLVYSGEQTSAYDTALTSFTG